MKWEARKISNEKWGCFLMEEVCKTDEPVCYSAASGKYAEMNIREAVKRINEYAESSDTLEDLA